MHLHTVLLLAVTFFPVAALAQSATFDLVVDNKPSGRDTYTLAKDKHGYKLASKYHFNVHAVDGDFLNQYKFSDTYAFGEASMSDNCATPIAISYTPNKARTEMSISRFQAGSQDSSFFSIKKDFFLLPAFDAGAAQVLLLAQTLPTAPVTPNVYSPDTDGNVRNPVSNDAEWIKGPRVQATLEGAPVSVQTYLLATKGFQWIFYAGDANALLECDLPAVKTSYIRERFKLTEPPPKLADFLRKPAA